MLIPAPAEAVLNFPWHVTKGIAYVSSWPIRAIMNTPDMPTQTPEPKEGESVYDIAKPMLDIASIIYYYTELRSETKARLLKYGENFNLSPRQMDDIRNAILYTETSLEEVKQANRHVTRTHNKTKNDKTSKKVKTCKTRKK